MARFSDPAQKRMLEEAGAHPIAFDLADPDLSSLPKSVDVVINYAVLPPQNNAYEVNAGAAGRLARRYRTAKPSYTAAPVRSTSTRANGPCARTIPTVCTPPPRTMPRARSRRIPSQTSQRGLPATGRAGAHFLLLRPAGWRVTQRIDQMIRDQPASIPACEMSILRCTRMITSKRPSLQQVSPSRCRDRQRRRTEAVTTRSTARSRDPAGAGIRRDSPADMADTTKSSSPTGPTPHHPSAPPPLTTHALNPHHPQRPTPTSSSRCIGTKPPASHTGIPLG